MKKTGLSQKQSYETVEVFLESAKDALRRGEKVCLVGFGTFLVRKRNARKCHNPRTGEKLTVPPKRVAVFKPGKDFRQRINRK